MSRPSKKKHTTPEPRKEAVLLKNPVEISEDEADMLVARQRLKEPTITLEEYLRRHGHELARRDS
ncbi:MAG: hypothetical protein ACK5AZ_12415 [Bryobacteraceae bacterium]